MYATMDNQDFLDFVEEEDDEVDLEMEELMNIINEGIDDTLLFNTLSTNNVSLLDFLCRNDFFICPEYLSQRNSEGLTALHLATKNEQNAFCTYLLKQGADVNQTDSNGNTALHWAVATSDNWSLVNEFILGGSDYNILNGDGQTALHVACKKGHLLCIQSLVLHGSDFRTADNNGMISLHLAALHGNYDVVEYIINNVEDREILKTTDSRKRTALHAAACISDNNFENGKEIIELLLNNNILLNSEDEKGRTALFWSISRDDFRIFEYLFTKEPNVNHKDVLNRTVLHYAAYYKNLRIMKILLEANADANAPDYAQCTPLHASIGCKDGVNLLMEHGADPMIVNQENQTPMHSALAGGFEESFLRMLQYDNKKLLLNHRDARGRSLLHYCSSREYIESFRLLKELGVDDSVKDNNGNNIVHFASNFGRTEIIKEIIASTRKHKISSYISGGNASSQKPLHLAAARGNEEACKFLLENRGSSWAPDKYGCTALHYAALYHNFSSLPLLLEYNDHNRTDKHGAKPIHYAVMGGCIRAINIFQQLHSNQETDKQGRTPIFYAPSEEVLLHLFNSGYTLDTLDKLQRNILFTAIQLQHRKIFRILIEKYNVDMYTRDSTDITLLHQAAYCGDTWFIKYLLKNSTLNPFVLDKENRSPLYFAASVGHEDSIRELLNGLSEENQAILLNQRDSKGRSSLDAAAFGHHSACIILLTKKMNVNEKYLPANDGRTPLHAMVNHSDSVDAPTLLELMKYFDVNQVDARGRGCLYRAVYRNLSNHVQFFLENGADVNIQDEKGITPLMVAVALDYSDIEELLRQFHPDLELCDKQGRNIAAYIAKRESEQIQEESEEDDDESEEDYEENENNEKVSLNTGSMDNTSNSELTDSGLVGDCTQSSDNCFDSLTSPAHNYNSDNIKKVLYGDISCASETNNLCTPTGEENEPTKQPLDTPNGATTYINNVAPIILLSVAVSVCIFVGLIYVKKK